MEPVIFMGTPAAAVPSLVALSDICDVDVVVTRPDRPRGRSGRPQPTPVKVEAEQLGLAVVQPHDRDQLREMLARRLRPDVGVVVAFGMILEPAVLARPVRGFLNVHFSLLPRWRGAAPVERAIMAGDVTTGVTLMEMDEGLDTGPVVAASATAIGPDETGGEVTDRLARMGADLLAATLPGWIDGTVTSEPQAAVGSTYAPRIVAEDRDVDSSFEVATFVNTVRALAPDPGARLWIGDQPHKILQVARSSWTPAPGTWVDADGTPILGLADGAVEIRLIQPPGKRPMAGDAWLRGRPLPPPNSAPGS